MKRLCPPRSLIEFGVVGDPTTQGSKSGIVQGDRVVIVEARTNKGRRRHKDWRAAISAAAADVAARRAVIEPLDGALAALLVFRLPMPKSRYAVDRRRGWRYADVGYDIDKLTRLTFDSLTTADLIRDDSRIAHMSVTKIEVGPGEWTGVAIAVGRVVQHDGPIPGPLAMPTLVAP